MTSRMCAGFIVTAVFVLAVAGSAMAQGSPATPPQQVPRTSYETSRPGIWDNGGSIIFPDDGMGFDRFVGELGGKTVTGAPFTATVSTQMSQMLADGNKIQHSTTGSFARDTQGRTRRDMTLPAIGPWVAPGQKAPHAIFLNDPVKKTRYTLDPDKKVARQMPPAPDRADFMKSHPGSSQRHQNETTTSPLGTKTIAGVKAEGTRITRTIPAGEIGNEKPIQIVTEKWYSPDLQTTVMMKRDDPRQGETVYQLTNIQRHEPDASLLQVPSDYTVEQGQGGRHGSHERRRGMAPPPPPQQ